MKKTLNDESKDEVNTYKQRFRDVCFLLRSGKTCFGEELEDLKKVSHKVRYEYPEIVTRAYELLIGTTRQIGI